MDDGSKQCQVASMLAYAGSEPPTAQPEAVAEIKVPFRVGIGFVPDNGKAEFRLSEAERQRLDVVALISSDPVQYAGANRWSFL